MTDAYDAALDLAGELLGRPLELPLGAGEPDSGREFRRLATVHTRRSSSSSSTSRPTPAPRAPLTPTRSHPPCSQSRPDPPLAQRAGGVSPASSSTMTGMVRPAARD